MRWFAIWIDGSEQLHNFCDIQEPWINTETSTYDFSKNDKIDKNKIRMMIKLKMMWKCSVKLNVFILY